MKVFILLILFISSCFGHNWLDSPPSRNGNQEFATQNSPCDPATAASVPTTVVQQTESGGSLGASFTDQHAGTHYLYLVPASAESQLEQLNANSPQVVASLAVPVTGSSNPKSATITWGQEKPPGAHILQYRWNNYRNCAPIMLLASVPGNSEPIDGEPYKFKVSNGVYDASTGTVDCNTSYTPTSDNRSCKLNGAASFFLALFIILIVLLIVVVALVVLRRVNLLPEKVANVVEKAENKVFFCGKKSSSSQAKV